MSTRACSGSTIPPPCCPEPPWPPKRYFMVAPWILKTMMIPPRTMAPAMGTTEDPPWTPKGSWPPAKNPSFLMRWRPSTERFPWKMERIVKIPMKKWSTWVGHPFWRPIWCLSNWPRLRHTLHILTFISFVKRRPAFYSCPSIGFDPSPYFLNWSKCGNLVFDHQFLLNMISSL